MFKKLKEKIADEVKQNPRLQASLDSVNQLAAQAYSGFNKEGSGSRESLYSQTDPNLVRSNTSINQSTTSSSAQYFSLEEDEEPVNLSAASSPSKTPTPAPSLAGGMTSTPGMRGRRLSSSSTDASLFPIYEDPGNESIPLFSDLESTAGSEAGWDDSGSAQLSAVSKEQLYNMLAKMRARYHKYKGRYADLAKAYRHIQVENQKVKEVMQQTQDKALRRISELREQCNLEQQAKQHLEEELRAELEEKQHIIVALNTKVSLLKENAERLGEAKLVDLSTDSGLQEEGEIQQLERSRQTSRELVECDEEERTAHLGDKVKRLESLLAKCKENIKANKQKTVALTEVKEQLAAQLITREEEIKQLQDQNKQLGGELELLRSREVGEEIQLAETKLAMHREMLEKDEQMAELQRNLTKEREENERKEKLADDLKKEIEEMGKAQASMEIRLEEERKTAMEELSRGKEAALEQERNRLQMLHKKETERELSRCEEEWARRLKEVEEEGRLGREELELRLSALTGAEQQKAGQLEGAKQAVQTLRADKIVLEDRLAKLTAELQAAKRGSEAASSLAEDLRTVKEDLKQRDIRLLNSEKEGAELRDRLAQTDATLQDRQRRVAQAEARVSELEDLRGRLEAELREKEREGGELLAALAKAEEEVRERCEQLEQQRSQESQQHRLNLQALQERLEVAGESVEASLQSRLDILKESQAEELREKENEIRRLSGELEAALAASREFEERLQLNLETSMRTEEEFEIRAQQMAATIASLEDLVKEKDAEKESCLAELATGKARSAELEATLQQLEGKLVQYEQEIASSALKLATVTEDTKEIFRLQECVQEMEATLALKVEELRDANEKVEDLQNSLETLQHLEGKAKLLEDQLDLKVIELRDSNEELEELRRLNDEKSSCKLDLEKELQSLKEQVSSRQASYDQMVQYQKDLQTRLDTNDREREQLAGQLAEQQQVAAAARQEVEQLRQAYVRQVDQLKQDLELKIRFEQEKENSIKELQKQSIEYEKKLQDQLEEKNQELDNLKALAKRNKAERKSVKEAYEKELASLEAKLVSLNQMVAQKEQERRNLDEKREMLETILNDKDTTFKALEAEIASLRADKTALDGDVNFFRREQQAAESRLEQEVRLVAELEERLGTVGQEKTRLDAEVKALTASSLESAGQLAEYEDRMTSYSEKISQLNDIVASKEAALDRQSFELTEAKSRYEEVGKNIANLENENKKLSKSRDRLKSLLDEKERSVSELQMEKAKLTGSQEEVQFQTKEQMSTLTEEVIKLRDLSDSLRAELSELRQNAENLTREKKAVEEELASCNSELTSLRAAHSQVTNQQQQLTCQLEQLLHKNKELVSSLELAVASKLRFEEELAATGELKSRLAAAESQLGDSQSEAEQLRSKLRQLEAVSSLTELKEENAMLEEKVSQLEEQLSQMREQLSDGKTNQLDGKHENQLRSLAEDHLLEKAKLKKQIAGLEEELKEFKNVEMSNLSDDTERKIKSLVREWERRIAVVEAEREQELEKLQEDHDEDLARIQLDHKGQLSRLIRELEEKSQQMEQLAEERHSLAAIQAEEREQIKVLEEKIDSLKQELERRNNGISSWGWDEGEEDEVETMNKDSPAIFGVPNHTTTTSSHNNQNHKVSSQSLEDNPEFEYLRNILYEYMMGRQPMILVKVLSAIVKFSPEQVSAIMKAEERKQSLLAPLGLS